MPKSKAQKQMEAIERNRSMFGDHRRRYMSWQLGGDRYINEANYSGVEKAQLEAARQRVTFEKWCKEHGVDKHGNYV